MSRLRNLYTVNSVIIASFQGCQLIENEEGCQVDGNLLFLKKRSKLSDNLPKIVFLLQKRAFFKEGCKAAKVIWF